MKNLNALDWVMLVLLIIGGINWGLIGLAQFDLVAFLFGGQAAPASRIIYSLVGVSALYIAAVSPAFRHEKMDRMADTRRHA